MDWLSQEMLSEPDVWLSAGIASGVLVGLAVIWVLWRF